MGGALKNSTPADMQTAANKAALASANLKPQDVDSVVVGNVLQVSTGDGAFVSRHSALKAGIPNEVPALTINRLCGSGFQSIVNGAQVSFIKFKGNPIAIKTNDKN